MTARHRTSNRAIPAGTRLFTDAEVTSMVLDAVAAEHRACIQICLRAQGGGATLPDAENTPAGPKNSAAGLAAFKIAERLKRVEDAMSKG